MKKLLLTTSLVASLFIGGCVSTGSVPEPTDSNYPAYISNLEDEVKTYTGLATALYLFSNTDGEERVEIARFANEVAKAIQAKTSEDLDLDDVKAYAAELITKNTDDEDKVVVGLLFNYVTALIQDKLDIKLQIDDLGERTRIGIRMVKAASDAVIEATDPVISENVLAPQSTDTLPQ